MLYISRKVGVNSFGVCDTQDGVEEVIGLTRLGSIVNGKSDIHIEGVSLRQSKLSNRKSIYSGRVICYQSPKYATANQVKLRMMYNAGITLWRGMITSLDFSEVSTEMPAVMKLSDFGRSCADRILENNQSSLFHKATLMLDDFLEFSEHTFIRGRSKDNRVHHGYGVVYDIRGLNDDVRAKYIYDAVLDGTDDYWTIEEIIKDREDRMNAMLRGLGVMRF